MLQKLKWFGQTRRFAGDFFASDAAAFLARRIRSSLFAHGLGRRSYSSIDDEILALQRASVAGFNAPGSAAGSPVSVDGVVKPTEPGSEDCCVRAPSLQDERYTHIVFALHAHCPRGPAGSVGEPLIARPYCPTLAPISPCPFTPRSNGVAKTASGLRICRISRPTTRLCPTGAATCRKDTRQPHSSTHNSTLVKPTGHSLHRSNALSVCGTQGQRWWQGRGASRERRTRRRVRDCSRQRPIHASRDRRQYSAGHRNLPMLLIAPQLCGGGCRRRRRTPIRSSPPGRQRAARAPGSSSPPLRSHPFFHFGSLLPHLWRFEPTGGGKDRGEIPAVDTLVVVVVASSLLSSG